MQTSTRPNGPVAKYAVNCGKHACVTSGPPWNGADRGPATTNPHEVFASGPGFLYRRRRLADSSLIRTRIPGRRTLKVFCEPAGQGLSVTRFSFFCELFCDETLRWKSAFLRH
jgi:hypothetical protein